jgi:hypothetical protein
MANGHIDHLTCIIGVAVNKRPFLGVVHKPFGSNPIGTLGRTYVGIPKCGLFVIYHSEKIENYA